MSFARAPAWPTGCADKELLKQHCPQTCEACEPDETEPVEFCADHLRDEKNDQYECADLSSMGVCQAAPPSPPTTTRAPAPTPAEGQGGADVTEYRYQDRPWYKALRALPVTRTLTQADFAEGTFRITQPGRYQLAEDIAFAPNADLADSKSRFWPPIHSSKFPMGQFYLGFFAAVTIETDNVWLDLNGFEIKQRFDFYVRQRWYANIELSDRAFVANEGVFSLKNQEGDKMYFNPDGTAREGAGGLWDGGAGKAMRHRFGAKGAGKSANKVIISNGALGLSSHAGIHGNGNTHVVVEDVAVADFDVAGVQFNGGDYVAVVDSTVGPSHQVDVPSHRLSHAIFLSAYAQRFLPGGLFHLRPKYPGVPYDATLRKLTGTISFADRPGEDHDVQWVFDRLYYAQELFINDLLPQELRRDDGVLAERETYGVTLAEAKELFANPTGLPDGSALYGIIFHRLGAATAAIGAQDEMFHGPEHTTILIKGVAVRGLKHHTVMVPSLAFADGTFLQGPVRDVIDVANIVSDRLQSPKHTHYKGNYLSDSYLALWQLSTAFYGGHILASDCGNFGSNLTSNFADCNGVVVNTKLTGRDIVMLQKKYFGGIKLSKGFYDWATTPGAAFADLIDRSPDVVGRRRDRHYVTCGHDTMFHENKGAIGVRLEFVENVVVVDTNVTDISNTADVGHWLCGEKWRLPDTGELIEVKQLGARGDLGGDVRGITMAKVDGVKLANVRVDGLASLEGQALGIALAGDANDRRDYAPRYERQVALLGVDVGAIVAGAGRVARPLSVDLSTVAAGSQVSVSTAGATRAHNHLDAPRVSMVQRVSNKTVPVSKGNYVEMSFMPSFMINRERVLAAFGYNDAQMNALALEAIGYLESEFGINRARWRTVDEKRTAFHGGVMAHPRAGNVQEPGYGGQMTQGPIAFADNTAWNWYERLVLVDRHDIVFFGVQRHPGQDFHTDVMCRGTVCAGPLQESPAHNFVFLAMLNDKTTQGAYKAHGLWGGPEGKLVYPSQILIMGTYMLENPPLEELGLAGPGRAEDIMIRFYGTCPIDFAGTRTPLNLATSKCGTITDAQISADVGACTGATGDGGELLGCKVKQQVTNMCCTLSPLKCRDAKTKDDCRGATLSNREYFVVDGKKNTCVPDDWQESSIINCKLDGGPLLGKGWGVGTYSLVKSNGVYTLEITDEQIFDDHPRPYARGIGTGVTNNRCSAGKGKMAGHPLVVQVRVDGVIPVNTPFHGREILPHAKPYHQFHEAGSKFFRDWAGMSVDQMYALRDEAFRFLRDDMMLGTPTTAAVPNPNLQAVLDNPRDHYIDNDIALGGGNGVFPYATNDLLNQRAYTLAGTAVAATHLANATIKEGGFIMVAGRAGLHSKEHGYLPYGTVIKYGIYIINDLAHFGTVRVNFKDSQPMIPDLVDHGSINQQLWTDHPALASFNTGIAQGLVSSFDVGQPNFNNRGANPARGAGLQYNTRFSMLLGTVDNPLGEEVDLGVMCSDAEETGTYYDGYVPVALRSTQTSTQATGSNAGEAGSNTGEAGSNWAAGEAGSDSGEAAASASNKDKGIGEAGPKRA